MLDISGPRVTFLALEIYTLGKQTVRIKNYISCCIFVSPVGGAVHEPSDTTYAFTVRRYFQLDRSRGGCV